jgi:CheY-like chemotaxis protein
VNESGQARTAAKMAKILCIDDESTALRIRKRVLETAGHQVQTTRSGEAGMRLLRSDSFDLVLLDYWMPGMNGIVTAREVKRINPSVPMIILSGLSQLPDETMGVVDRWIRKDEGPQFLLKSIKDLLNPAS